MSQVLVLGNATLDVIQRVARLPLPGETVLAQGLTRCAGGKGLNQAVAASRTGAATRLAAPAGRDADAAFVAAALAAVRRADRHVGDLGRDGWRKRHRQQRRMRAVSLHGSSP
jgi:sugar/nucleoside kinase (ribokinase family)